MSGMTHTISPKEEENASSTGKTPAFSQSSQWLALVLATPKERSGAWATQMSSRSFACVCGRQNDVYVLPVKTDQVNNGPGNCFFEPFS
jgi:hypothetical protein